MQETGRMSYDEKLALVARDARAAAVALAAVVAVWFVCGFGLSGLNVTVFHTPLWVVAGLLGTWAAAMVAAAVLSRVFKDFDLEDGADEAQTYAADVPGAGAAQGAGAAPAVSRSLSEAAETEVPAAWAGQAEQAGRGPKACGGAASGGAHACASLEPDGASSRPTGGDA